MPHKPPVRAYISELDQHTADDENLVRAFDRHPGSSSVRFACDYSEIFAFTHVLAVDRVSYLSQYDRPKQIALNEAWASRLFFDETSRPRLLDPYRVELATLVHNVAMEPLSEIVEAIELLRRAEGEPDEWLQWLRSIDEGLASPANPTDALSLLIEIYRRAPGLMLLMSDDLRPARRLQHLLRAARFQTLTQDSERVSPSAKTQQWWTRQLHSRRPGAATSSNVIDAMALALLQAINLDPRSGKSTVLVSRSDTMRRILAIRPDEGGDEYDAATEGIYIVHPRVLGSYLVAERSGASVREVIENRYWLSLETRELYAKHSYDDRFSYDLRKMISLVRARWAEVDDVSIVQSIWSGKGSTEKLTKAGQASLAAVGNLIRGQASVRTLLSERASALAQELSLNSAMIAAIGVLDADPVPAQPVDVDVQVKDVPTNADRPSLVVKTSSKLMSYSLQLFDPDFGRMWNETGGDVAAALSQFIKAQIPGTGYERLLGTGYTLASVGSWEVAYQFFNLAATFEPTSVPKHEAYYFRAVTRRQASERTTELMVAQSLADAEAALLDKRRIRGETYIDPRYLCEIGVLLGVARHEGFSVASEVLGTADPVVVWQKALDAVTHDLTLRVQLLNNIVYHLYSQTAGSYGSQLRAAFGELVAAAATAGQEKLTYGIEHTIIVVTLALGGGTWSELHAARNSLFALQGVNGASRNLQRAVADDLALIEARLASLDGHA